MQFAFYTKVRRLQRRYSGKTPFFPFQAHGDQRALRPVFLFRLQVQQCISARDENILQANCGKNVALTVH